MRTDTQQESKPVCYYAITEQQLRDIIKEGVKQTLHEMGYHFQNGNKLMSSVDDEARPIDYWVKKLGVNRTTLWRRQKEGLLTPTYMGKKLFYRPSDIDRMFSKMDHM